MTWRKSGITPRNTAPLQPGATFVAAASSFSVRNIPRTALRHSIPISILLLRYFCYLIELSLWQSSVGVLGRPAAMFCVSSVWELQRIHLTLFSFFFPHQGLIARVWSHISSYTQEWRYPSDSQLSIEKTRTGGGDAWRHRVWQADA